uniref:hypothetical protein n=1 Tax=Streptosporangium sp. CA-235898 TaxID=3240073 RepID=UPI003F4938FE
MTRPLTCPRCRGPVAVVEDVLGHLDWGLAVVDDDGTVRPQIIPDAMPVVTADNSTPSGRPRAVCDSRTCGYEWRLRRRFTPASADATSGGKP